MNSMTMNHATTEWRPWAETPETERPTVGQGIVLSWKARGSVCIYIGCLLTSGRIHVDALGIVDIPEDLLWAKFLKPTEVR